MGVPEASTKLGMEWHCQRTDLMSREASVYKDADGHGMRVIDDQCGRKGFQ